MPLRIIAVCCDASTPARQLFFIVAIATNTPAQLPQTTLRPVLDLDDPDAVVEWLVQNGERFDYSFDIR